MSSTDQSQDAREVPGQVQRRSLLALAGAGIATMGLASCAPLPASTSASKAAPAGPLGTTSPPAATSPTTKPATSSPKPGTASTAPVGATSATGPTAATGPKATATNTNGVAGSPTRPQSASLPILKASSVAAPGETVPNLLGTDPVWHLVRRATFGPTPELVAEVRAKGTGAWLDEQLNPASIVDTVCDDYLKRYASLPMTTMQIRAAYPAYSWTPMNDLGRAAIARALWSKRQLFEVMVEFWSNHFNVTSPSGEVWDLKTVEDRDVIRRNALGRFADLLTASAKSPAMMRYLDNATSSVDTLNENYGRELLELHTVGVDAGYTQAEVVDSARLMTGYTVGRHGEFAYYNDWRYVGPVQVLGFSHPNGNDFDGLKVAEQYLDYLAHHPSTARRVATKLCIRFVADTAPASLVEKLASVYLANDTAIAPVLRALFTSPEFAAGIGQKTKRPLEDLVGAARIFGVAPAPGDNTSLSNLYWTVGGMGQAPFNWGPPNGFPDVAGAWLSTAGTVGRWNAHAAVIGGWATDGMTTPSYLSLVAGATPADNGALVDLLSQRFLGVRLADPQRSAIVTFLTASGTPKVADSLRWRVDILALLILDSPNWIQR